MKTKACALCKSTFVYKRASAKFCSESCKQKSKYTGTKGYGRTTQRLNEEVRATVEYYTEILHTKVKPTNRTGYLWGLLQSVLSGDNYRLARCLKNKRYLYPRGYRRGDKVNVVQAINMLLVEALEANIFSVLDGEVKVPVSVASHNFSVFSTHEPKHDCSGDYIHPWYRGMNYQYATPNDVQFHLICGSGGATASTPCVIFTGSYRDCQAKLLEHETDEGLTVVIKR